MYRQKEGERCISARFDATLSPCFRRNFQEQIVDSLVFLNDDQVRQLQAEFGTPLYVYDERTLLDRAASSRA